MSLWDAIFGKEDEQWFTGYPFKPQITPRHQELIRRAIALHPGAEPQFNLQPTIDMLEIADMYGFEVRRKTDKSA